MVPALDDDRPLSPDVTKLEQELLASGTLLAAVRGVMSGAQDR